MKKVTSRAITLVCLLLLFILAITISIGTKQHVRAEKVTGTERASTATSSSIKLAAPAYQDVSGEQRQLVMLLNFQDQPSNKPWSREFVQNVVFGQTKQYWESVSYNQISFTGDLVGWYTAAINTNDCAGNFRDAAENGARALGFEPTNYTHKIYIYPYRPCGAQGGITLLATDSSGNTRSWVYLNGAADFYSVAHEVGHTFGFRHSNSLNCSGASFGSNCAHVEYGDYYDLMGYWNTGVANSYQRDRAGWLGARIQTVTGDGTFVLTPTGNTDDNLKAIRIPQSHDPMTNSTTYYYVEYRQPFGYDAFLSNYPLVTNGVLIRIGTIGNDVNKLGFGSQLLDLTPAITGRNEALPVGASYTDPAIPLTVTVLSANPLGATVSVQFAAQPNPTPTVTPTPTPAPTPTPIPEPTSMTLSISTDRSTYSTSQNVLTRAVVLSSGVPMVGKGVSFTITRSNGLVVRMTGTTGTDGSVTVKYRLTKKDPSGTYEAKAAATLNGSSVANATTFRVSQVGTKAMQADNASTTKTKRAEVVPPAR